MAERTDSIRVHIEGKEYFVVGGGFREMLAAVKQINGRRFLSALKAWELPVPVETVRNQLEISGYQLEGGKPLSEETLSAKAQAPAGNDRIKITVQGHQLAVAGGSFQELLAAVKSLPGRRFDGQTKVWEIPGDLSIIKNLIETAGFRLEGAENLPLDAPATPPAEFSPPPGAPPPAPPPEYNPPPVAPPAPPPAYQPPDFSADDDDAPPYEPPDWWDDDDMPPPPVQPPEWWEDEPAAPPPASPPGPAAPASSPEPAANRGADQIRVRVGGIPILVMGGTFQAMLAAVKQVPGRRFDGQDKTWDLPADLTLEGFQQRMEAAGFTVQRG